MALDSVICDACRLIALAPHPKWPGLVGRSSVRRFTTSGYIVGEMEKGPALASFRNWGGWGSPQVHVGGGDWSEPRASEPRSSPFMTLCVLVGVVGAPELLSGASV